MACIVKFHNIKMKFVKDFNLISYCSEKFLYWKRLKVEIEMSVHKYSTCVYIEH